MPKLFLFPFLLSEQLDEFHQSFKNVKAEHVIILALATLTQKLKAYLYPQQGVM